MAMSNMPDTVQVPPPAVTLNADEVIVHDTSGSLKAGCDLCTTIQTDVSSCSCPTLSCTRSEKCSRPSSQLSDCHIDIEGINCTVPAASKLSSTTSTDDNDSLCVPNKRSRPKRFFSLTALSPHRRLMALVAMINLSILTIGIVKHWWYYPTTIGTVVIANIFTAIMIRQQRIINLLFKIATVSRTSLPLPVRWALAKIYHFGGLHSGCSVAATVWLLLFSADVTWLRVGAENGVATVTMPSVALLVLTYIIDVLLVTIVTMALPALRTRFHNSFEISHRFMGWSVLALVWAQSAILIFDYRPAGSSKTVAFFSSASPYLLAIITLSILSPWLSLRKVKVYIEKPSDHSIIVSFPEGVRPAFAGSSCSISLSPWLEWHSFANIPSPGRNDFRMVISRAGDWTSRVIDNPPSHFWVRGIPTAGVASVGKLFHHVLYIATGSGIAPVMPHLLAREVRVALFWSARNPRTTYGEDFVDEILEACPDSVVFDTEVKGKPDMVAWACKRLNETGAEAVICISNQILTRKVVYGLEARGIPAFGAIWDS